MVTTQGTIKRSIINYDDAYKAFTAASATAVYVADTDYQYEGHIYCVTFTNDESSSITFTLYDGDPTGSDYRTLDRVRVGAQTSVIATEYSKRFRIYSGLYVTPSAYVSGSSIAVSIEILG